MKKWLKKALSTLACAVMGATVTVGAVSCSYLEPLLNKLKGGESSTDSSIVSEQTHEHSYTESNVVEATCTAEGSKTLTCTCGDVKEEVIEKLAHTFTKEDASEEYLATEATCESAASYYYSCEVCGAADTNTFEVGTNGTHTWVSNADAKYLVSEATCDAFAVYYKSCEACGEAGTETFTYGDLKAHTWVETVSDEYLLKKAGCENAATYAKNCSACGNKGGETFTVGEPLGHEYQKTTIEPSCFVDGFDSYTCDRCGDTYADLDSLVKAPGEHIHTPVVTEPTCSAQGYTTYTCTCGDSYVADYTSAEHTYESTVVPATCSTMGYTLHTCVDCGDNYKDTYVKVTDHAYTRNLVKEASCQEEGEYAIVFTCACNKTEKEPIPKTAHVYVANTPVAATCTAEGYTEYVCTCGDSYKKDFVAATGHSYTKGVTEEATCTEKGYTEYVCACNDSYRVETAALGHTLAREWVLVTDDEGNEVLTHIEGCTYERTYTNECATCGTAMEKKEERSKHNYAANITVVATCQAAGEKTFTCTVEGCGHSYTEEYNPTDESGNTIAGDHQWSTTEATGGVETVYCTVEGCKESKQTLRAEGTDATVSKEALSQAGEVQMEAALIKLDNETLEQLTSGEGDLDLHASTLDDESKNAVMGQMSEEEKAKLEGKPIYNFTVDGGNTTQFKGMVTVTVPYELLPGEDADAIEVWYINEDGQVEPMPATYTLIEGEGYAVFQTNHFSSYTIVRLTPSERCEKYGHDLKSREVLATCEADGYYLVYCIRCGYNETAEVYTAYGHNYIDEAVEATCTAQGYTSHECGWCGKYYVDNYVDALGHDYTSKTVEATCETAGYVEYTCGRCNNSYQDITEEALGHEFKGEKKHATCQVPGHTQYKCTRCKAKYEADFEPKTDHEYEAVENEPTCSEKGYVRHTCKHCGESYDDNFKDKTKHKYEATVVEPTCTAKGYTLYVCKDKKCGDSYKANYVSEKGHVYGADYKCEVCGAEHPAVSHGAKGFYVSLRDSVMNANSYFVTVNDITFADIMEENGTPAWKEEGAIKVCKLTFAFDEDGYLVGHGEFQMDMEYFDYEGDGYVSNGKESFIFNVVFKDGKMYAFVKGTDGDSGHESYMLMSQEKAFNTVNFPILALKASYLELYSENAQAIIATAMGVTNKQINEALGAVVDFMFVKTDTGSGYTFTLNADQLYSVVEKLTDRSAKVLFEGFFGTGSFDKLFDRTHEVLDMTIGELEDQIESRLNAAGYTIDDLYNIANYAFGMVFAEASHMDEVDLKASLEEYKDDVIGQLVADEMGYTTDKLHTIVDKIKTMCETRDVVSVLLEVSGEARNKAEADEMVDELLAEVKKVIPYLGGTEITLTTDKAGKASALSVKLDIELDKNTYNSVIIGGSVIERVNTIIIKGDGTITFNSTYESTLGELPGQVSQLINKFTLKDGQTIESEEIDYIVYKTGTETFIGLKHDNLPSVTSAQNAIFLGEETIGGVTYKKYTVYYGWFMSMTESDKYYNEDFVWYFGQDAGVITGETCGDWTEYDLLGKRGYAYYTVWAKDDGTVVRYELDLETTKDNLDGSGSFYLWYNKTTDETKRTEPHDYQLVNTTVTGEGCNQVTTKYYECSICKDTHESKSSEEHNIRYRSELVEGATSCEDGWVLMYYCTKCDYVEYENYYESEHSRGEQYVVVKTDCGEVEFRFYTCACGYYNRWDKWLNDGNWELGHSDCQLEDYKGKVEFDEEGFPINAGCKKQCTVCGAVFELQYESSDENGKYDKYYRADVAVKDEGGVKVEITDKNEGSFYPENGKDEEYYPEGDYNKPEDGYKESCYSTGSIKLLMNGEVVFEQSYSVAHHMYVNYNEEYVDGYRVATETCQCGVVFSTSKMDDMGRTVYYVNEKGVGYRREYNGCEVTTIYFNEDGDYRTETSKSHNGNYTYVVSLPWYAESCLDGIVMERYCGTCGEHMGTQSGDYGEHYYGETVIKEIKTACGTLYVEYATCACGQNTMFNNVTADGCDLSYSESDTEMSAVCTSCGARFVATAEFEVNGCEQTVHVVANIYVNNNVVWSITYDESYVSHSMDKYSYVDENGNTVSGTKCAGCGMLENESVMDASGRTIRQVYPDGSGYYVEFDGCYATTYRFDSNGEVYGEMTRESHTMGYTYEFLTDEKNCEAGVLVTWGCTVCDYVEYTEETKEHYSRHATVYTTRTECGEIRLYGETCGCGYAVVMWGGLWVDGNCHFDYNEEYTWDEETGYESRKEIRTCMECGFVYTVESYYTQEQCAVTRHIVYTLGDKEFHYSTQVEDRHNWRYEEGARDDGTYLCELYCENCNTWQYHYEFRRDEYGRRTWYMDRLAGEGWEKVFENTCEYKMYVLDQAGNRGEYTEGIEHPHYRDRYELLPGSVDCDDGVMYYWECPECGTVEHSYKTVGHHTFEHIETYQTDCGKMYFKYYECACGKKVEFDMDIYGICNMQQSDIEWPGLYIDHTKATYDCCITDCGFKYIQEYYVLYETAGSCRATLVNKYSIYNNGKLVTTKTGTRYETRHLWETRVTELAGVTEEVRVCTACGVEYLYKWDAYGRMIYYWDGVEGEGWMRIFTICDYVEIHFNRAGNRWGYWTGTEHAWRHDRYIKPSCTQYGTWLTYCACCQLKDSYDYVMPSHNYEWNEYRQLYICSDCGLENQKNVDGDFVVEDLTAKYDNVAYTAGFFNTRGDRWEMEEGYNFYIVLNYGLENEEVTEGVLYDFLAYGYELTGGAGSGIITLDMETLNAAIEEAYGADRNGFVNVSIVFQVFDKYDAYGQYSYVDHVLTFTRI